MRSSAKRAVAALALALALSPAYADSFVLKNVRIVSPGRPTVESGMIIVSLDKIVHVGAPASYEVGFTEIDCAGLTAYPGFIDAYARYGLNLPASPTPPTAPAATDGPLATMWHENRKGVFADLDVSAHIDTKALQAMHKQGVTVAMLAGGRGAFGGLTAVTAMIEAEKPVILTPRLFQEVTFNSLGGGYPGSMMARIALLRQLFFDGEHYLAHPPENGDADAVVSAIGDVAAGIQRAVFAADSEREIQRALNLIDEFGLRVTLYGTSAVWQHADALKQRRISVIAQASLPREPRREQSEDPVRRLNDPPTAYLDEQYKTWQEDCLAVVKMHMAGVKFALCSDGGTDAFIENLRKQVGLGLPADAALRAVTTDAAEILGIADRAGTIEVGKLANLVLMTGDWEKPDSKIKHVFVTGKKFDIAEGN